MKHVRVKNTRKNTCKKIHANFSHVNFTHRGCNNLRVFGLLEFLQTVY